ncbi:MAG: DUF3472 domain-containing protein [Cytophagales bacterium]|nr:MAG: DUF3472 domain-containing protein [Cytophagales bacterium]
MKKLAILSTILVFLNSMMDSKSSALFAQANMHSANAQNVPIGGNAWADNGATIEKEGLSNWTDPISICTAYLRLAQAGTLKLSVFWNADNQGNEISITVLGKSKEIVSKGKGEKEYYAGEWTVGAAGYVAISIQGIEKSGDSFGVLKSLKVSGSAVSDNMSYVKNDIGDFFYWGRRGPSVHLNFDTEELGEIEWFYSEINVPKNNDVIGSYFMANGFGEGYFGMQVNSEEERRVIFSVWSSYQTDDPNKIPEDEKIILLQKGKNVYTGEFGNEGSGGQSYLKYNWKAGNTYKFLLKGAPAKGNYTIYTAYFFIPEENNWQLIASFKRPKTSTYLTNLYSFLENFIPETGNTERMAYYGNQWAVDKQGKWTELKAITFTADDTARKNFRKDYSGGTSGNTFYLKNCGFYNDFTVIDKKFTRNAIGKQPLIDFSKLK